MRPSQRLHTALLALLWTSAASPAESPVDEALLERGRYLLVTSGCHDCHTPGYAPTEGKVPQADWFTGSVIGFQGPWGTSYPTNLRLYAQALSEAQWLQRVRQPMRPPMPWFNLREMTDTDLRAMFAYLRALGPAGVPAPAPAAPGVTVTTPYFDFTPKNLPPGPAAPSP